MCMLIPYLNYVSSMQTHSRYLMQCLTHGRHSSNDNDYKESPDNIRHSVSDHKNGQITVKTETSTLKSAISYHSILWNNCDCNMIGGEKRENPESVYNMPLFIQFQNIYEAIAKEVQIRRSVSKRRHHYRYFFLYSLARF